MEQREFSTAAVLTLVTGKSYGDIDPERTPRQVLREAFEVADHVFGASLRLYQRVGRAGDEVDRRLIAHLPWLAHAVENAPNGGDTVLRSHLAAVKDAVGATQTLPAGQPYEGYTPAEDWPEHWGPYSDEAGLAVIVSDAPPAE